MVPGVSASAQQSFPNISFSDFAHFVENNFSSKISLAAVLTILFTLTNNVDTLNLHGRQQISREQNESCKNVTGWIKCLAQVLEDKLDDSSDHLFKKSEKHNNLSENKRLGLIGEKLDNFSKTHGLRSFNVQKNKFKNLLPISEEAIQPALLICPQVSECVTGTCRPYSLNQNTRERGIPKVALIKGTKIYNASILHGSCNKCKTKYYADHESSLDNTQNQIQSYINSATYLKIGQNL
jgi:hypothetical protein